MDAIVHYCEQNNIEIESAAKNAYKTTQRKNTISSTEFKIN